jgi:tRNA-specific 2-thiouridylase
MPRDRIVVGMSGGVDSAVVAAILKGQGYEVEAITLTFWNDEEQAEEEKSWQDRSCCKVGLARFVAQRLSIPHIVVDLKEVFRREVIEDFCDVYLSGATPNPCIRCNERIKFGLLLDLARERGAQALATGHYAKVQTDSDSGRVRLFRADDVGKDQSYFLYRLRQPQLAHVRFPLGSMRKEEVYQIAAELGLPYEEVLESQEICFVNQRDYREVLAEIRPESRQSGPIVDKEGKIVGSHEGVSSYTIGQRRGLRISAGQRLYVTDIRPEQNVVVVGEESALYRRELTVGSLNWIRWEDPPFPLHVEAKIRYRTAQAPARVEPIGGSRVRVIFDSPHRGITPGQSAVFYQEGEVVGGGIVERNR